MKAGVRSGYKTVYILLFLVAVGIVASQGGAYYYYQQSLRAACSNSCLSVETLINYGNGTSRWFNKTNIPSNWNFYDLTANISEVQSTYYQASSEHFVTGINGIKSNAHYFWSLWAVCENSKAWFATNVGADAIRVTDYHTLAWFYEASSQDSSTWTPPVPGAPKVNAC